MKIPSWLTARAWILVLAVACGYMAWTNVTWTGRINRNSSLPVAAVPVDATSPTGYAGGIRMLIAPEPNPASYQWIAQTQQMLAEGEWRLRHVNYDNAPEGREVHAPSPYRWWLGMVAGISSIGTDGPIGIAVERAAMWADPALFILLAIIVVAFVARTFGNLSGVVMAVGLVAIHPFSTVFLPGQPDSLSLTCLFSLLSLLPLIARAPTHGAPGLVAPTVGSLDHRRSFLAGIAGGCGMWVNVGAQVPILAGIGLGALLMAWSNRRTDASEPGAPGMDRWRVWGISGAATTLAAYLCEYFPSHLDVTALRLEVNHPLYALAWLGGGDLLARLTACIRTGQAPWRQPRRDLIVASLALAAVAAIPVIMLLHSTRGFLAPGLNSTRLSRLPEDAGAANLLELVVRDGAGAVGQILLPVIVTLAVAAWLLNRSALSRDARGAIALAFGPVAAVLVVSTFRLQAWSVLGCTLLVLATAVVVALSTASAVWRRIVLVGLALALLPGTAHLVRSTADARSEVLTEKEAQTLLERDLAHWLNLQAGTPVPVVLAPPTLTSALVYFGGLRGVATPYWENYDGFVSALRLAGATSLAEADSLMRRREISHVILPSWDLALDDLARLATNQPETALIAMLRQWQPPLWLRPVPYETPHMSGFAERSVGIFSFVDLQEDVTALSRLCEFFIESNRLDFASRVSRTIEDKYPNDLGGIVARAQVAAARQDGTEFARALQAIVEGVERGDDLTQPWDRRVNLAIMLAVGERAHLARAQLQRCLDDMDEPLLRSLSTVTLFRMQSLTRASGLEIVDPALRELALKLLPAALRERVQ